MEKFDVVIFGASGFTGKYTVLEAVQLLKDVKWGVAGRSKEKLEKILEEMGEKAGEDLKKIPIILADVSDEQSLRSMAGATKVLINCVGPYRSYGEPVVRACLDQGTHYVDFTAEPQFMERMQLLYNKEAQEKGVYIVSACGLESIAAEMGILHLEKQFNGSLNSVKIFFKVFFSKNSSNFSALTSNATWESFINTFGASKELREIREKLFKENLPKLEPKMKSNFLFNQFKLSGVQIPAPHLGADHSSITRTQHYFYEKENKRPIQFQMYFTVTKFYHLILLSLLGLIFLTLLSFETGKKILKKYAGILSLGLISQEGPTEEMMNNTKFDFTFIGEGWREKLDDPLAYNEIPLNRKMVTKLTTQLSVYGATCVAVLLSAKTILLEHHKIPGNGGVFSPGAAFSKTNLLNELTRNGFDYQIAQEN